MDYTNLYNFQTSTGMIVPTDSSVLLGIQTKFQEIFGTDIDLSAETPVGRLIEAFAVVIKSTLGVTAQNANQFNVNEATGIYLDAIAQIYDLKRIAGTKTRIAIKCYFNSVDSGTSTIPAGSIIMSSANGALYSIDAAITSTSESDEDDPDGYKVGYGTATAMEVGPTIAPVGTVNSIQSSVLGWVGVTNVSTLYTGTDIETDEEFRARIMDSRPVGIGFGTHLISALNRIDGVYSNCVLENNTGESIKKQGVVIPAHSIFVCIDCIETDDILNDIASEISRAKPVGTGMVDLDDIDAANKITLTVRYGYNNNYLQTITFYRAKRTAIKVALTYSVGNYSGADIEKDIADVISEYIATIGVGGIIKSAMIINSLINKLDIGVESVYLQRSGSKIPADTTIEMDGYETPYTSAANITMTAV